MSYHSNFSSSPGYSEGEGEGHDVDDDLDIVKAEGDQVIHLNYRGLLEMPKKLLDEAQGFQNVTRIYMKRNKLTTLPDDIGKLPCLVELYLPGNELISLPDSIAGLYSLESLDVSSNRLQTLTPAIGRLPALERLHLANNQLTSLPKDVSRLSRLRVLDVINNQLRRLPEEVVYCRRLQRLLVDRNLLQWLPTQMVTMDTLEELSATGNDLLCLPMDMGDMPSLKYVYVDNNPHLHAVPVSINNQELGFSSSGVKNFVGGPFCEYQYISIAHSVDESKRIYLPREIQHVGDLDTAPVTSLTELSLRALYMAQAQSLCPGDLPRSLYAVLRTPTCRCHVCMRPVFAGAFPLIFEGQIRLYNLYRLALCCSSRCVRMALLIVNLPLIYPSASNLHVAVALVD